MTSDEIEALAERIYVTLRAVADRYEEETDGSRQIRARYEEFRKNYSLLESIHLACTEWLRGVLAEAFGKGSDPC